MILRQLKILLCSLLLSFSLAAGEGGWFPVEKTRKEAVESQEDQPSSEVLFVAHFNGEEIQAYFPEEPTYSYLPNGDLEICCFKDGELFALTVRKELDLEDFPRTAPYQKGEKWVHEHVLAVNGLFYHLKTLNDTADEQSHNQFMRSFFIEKNH